MRIVCPRCVAQYEVDEAAIPETGREVQCANCENIWFQDYIEMLPDRTSANSAPHEDRGVFDDPEDEGVFDDLDGRAEVNFRSKRSKLPPEPAAPDNTPHRDDTDSDDAENLLADDLDADGDDEDIDDTLYGDEDDEDGDYDDDEPASNIPPSPVNQDVLNVLRSEAAFSSALAAREQLDAAAAKAIDGDGEERKLAADKAFAQHQEQETEEPATEHPTPDLSDDNPPADEAADADDNDVDFADLTAFLDAHTVDEEPAENPEPVSEADEGTDEDEDTKVEAGSSPPVFDPLADLDAIRSQLDTIGAEQNLDQDDVQDAETTDYTPVLPEDDPMPAPADESFDDLDLSDFADHSDLRAAIQSQKAKETHSSNDEEDEDDDSDDFEPDFAQDRPRHAYRADGGTPDDSTDHELDFDEETAAPSQDTARETPVVAPVAAAATLGLSRPRAKNPRPRARIMQGFGLTDDDSHTPESDPALDGTGLGTSETPDPNPEESAPTQQAQRKSLLPDVDELDASLRSESEQPRRRDREMREAHEQEIAQKSGGFRRAFVWTVFIVAVLIALYVLRPMIVSAVPTAAIVLDPYAWAIDNLRLLIDKVSGG